MVVDFAGNELGSPLVLRVIEAVYERQPRARLSKCLIDAGCPEILSPGEARSWLIALASVQLLCDTPALSDAVGLIREGGRAADGFLAGCLYTDIVTGDDGLKHDSPGALRLLNEMFDDTCLRIEFDAETKLESIVQEEFLHSMARITCTAVGARRIMHAIGEEDRAPVEELFGQCAARTALSTGPLCFMLRPGGLLEPFGTTVWGLTAHGRDLSLHLNAMTQIDETQEGVVHVTPISWAQSEIKLHEQIARTFGDASVEVGKGGFRVDLSGLNADRDAVRRMLGMAVRLQTTQ